MAGPAQALPWGVAVVTGRQPTGTVGLTRRWQIGSRAFLAAPSTSRRGLQPLPVFFGLVPSVPVRPVTLVTMIRPPNGLEDRAPPPRRSAARCRSAPRRAPAADQQTTGTVQRRRVNMGRRGWLFRSPESRTGVGGSGVPLRRTTHSLPSWREEWSALHETWTSNREASPVNRNLQVSSAGLPPALLQVPAAVAKDRRPLLSGPPEGGPRGHSAA